MRLYILLFLVLCFGLQGGLFGQNPRVVRIQVDACSVIENNGEYYQFVTADSNYDLARNNTSINITNPATGGAVSVSTFKGPTPAFLTALNNKINPCPKPVFINPYDPPYNGVIPPNSVVLAFVQSNPTPDALRSRLAGLCGRSPIFVIVASTNTNALFNNRASCSSSCLRVINIMFGNYTKSFDFDANKLLDITGVFLEINSKDSVLYKDSDGCESFSLPCDTPKIIIPNQSLFKCSSIGDTLPVISDRVTGNAYYYTLPNRSGTVRYKAGDVINQAIRLYASDFSNCDSAGTFKEQIYEVRIQPSPKIDDTIARTVTVCGYYILPHLDSNTVKNGQNPKYIFDPKSSYSYSPNGDTLRTLRINKPLDTILITAIDSDPSSTCVDTKKLVIIFKASPNLDKIKDINLSCGANFILPSITGSGDISNAGYYTSTQRNGIQILAGITIDITTTIYVNTFFDKCISEDTFSIKAPSKPIIPKALIQNDTFCTAFKLPSYNLLVSYNTRLDGGGIGFTMGSDIIASYKLYVTLDSIGCKSMDSVIYVRKPLFIDPKFIDEPCTPVFNALPKITGINLTGSEAFYSEKGGKGKKYVPGDTVIAIKMSYLYDSKILYMYDSTSYNTGKCVSEVPVIIPFFTIVELAALPDITADCNLSFTLPDQSSIGFFRPTVYSAPNKGGATYPWGNVITNPGTYYIYGTFSKCFDEDTFKILPPPSLIIPKSIFHNDSFCANSFKLPSHPKFSITYNTRKDGLGQPFNANNELINTATLYLTIDSSGCTATDSVTYIKKTILIDTLPIQEPCSSVFKDLPVITGTNLTGNQAYYSSPGGQGKKYVPGDTVMSFIKTNVYNARVLFAYDSGYCKFERPYAIPFNTFADLDQPKDTTVLCHELFTLPDRGNWSFFKPDIYSLPNQQGDKYSWGQAISKAGTYYTNYSVNPGLSKCFDEDTFKLNIDSGPIYTNNLDLKECNSVMLPSINGSKFSNDSTFYFVQPLGQGARFKPGTVINSNLELFIYDISQKCTAMDTVNIAISAPPNLDLKTKKFGCDSVLLPMDDSVGTNIKYYLQPGAIGAFKLPGDYIKTSTQFYKYTGTATCFSEDSFRIDITPSPQISIIKDTTACNEFILPTIVGNNLGTEILYHDAELPNNTRDYFSGDRITSNQRLVAFTRNNTGCISQQPFNITVLSKPDLSFINQSIQSCDTFTLPSAGIPGFKITNLGDASIVAPGTLINNSRSFLVSAGDARCLATVPLSVEIFPRPVLFPVRDTTACDEFRLPVIRGNSLSTTEHYHDDFYPLETTDFHPGTLITQSRRLLVFDSNTLGCVSERAFNITIIPRPTIDSIPPMLACEQLILPPISGANMTNPLYYESLNGAGKSYKPGESIMNTQTLYAYQFAPVCPAQQQVNFTIKDSITSSFTINPDNTCTGTPVVINHIGKKNNTTSYNWKITGPGAPTISNTPNQNLQLDTGQYKITLFAKGDGCVGDSVTKVASVLKPLDPLKNLTCDVTASSIIFQWDKTLGATDYQIDLLQGPFGVRSPQQMFFTNLALGARVGIRVTPTSGNACANGVASSLTCVTRQCDPITITIADERPFCSGDGPVPLTVFSIGLNPADSNKLTRVWSGKGIQNNLFYPSIAGPGDHIITYTLTKDSCIYMDTAVFKVGMGSLTILNTQPVECAPPSQRQFNISMQLNTPNKPVSIYYSFAGGRSSVYPFVSADRFTLSASFGLIGDSITIDSVLDANGCKMQLISNANTFTFKSVKFITKGDSTSVCDFSTKTYSYRVKIKNPNANDPLIILSGGGSIQDSFYLSGPIPFGTGRHVEISHAFACDTLKFDFAKICECTPYRDTIRRNACALETVRINNKDYTFTNPTGTDTIPSNIIGLCDTIRIIDINFIPDKVFNLNSSICPDDVITVGTIIFDKNKLSGTVRLAGIASTGCDSVVNVNLNLLSPVFRQVRDTICNGESVIIDGISFNANHTRDSIRYNNQAANGCDSVVHYTILVENVLATISQESVGCLSTGGRSVLISNASGGVGPYSYAFSTNPTSTNINSFPLKLTPPADTFDLIIKSANACTFTSRIAFNPINSGIKINLGSDRIIKLGDTVRINLNADFIFTNFKWITANYLSCTNCRNPIAQPLVSTRYIIEASDNNGCVARDTLLIVVDPGIDVYVPNIFSPLSANEANKELLIYPAPQVTAINRITIYDRRGNVYVDLKNPPISNSIRVWDGKFKGQPAPQGVYTYKLTFTTADGRSHVKYGTIALFR